MNVKLINGSIDSAGKIVTDIPLAEIFDHVTNVSPVVIKNVFNSQEAIELRNIAFEWGQKQQSLSADNFYNHTSENHFCIQQGVSRIQKTLHYYNSYNLNNYNQLEPTFRDLLMKFCIALRDFYNELTGNNADFTGDKIIHPQIIHYPVGGGHFAKHYHELEPQKIGVITSLSKYGKDFFSGGTGFEVNGEPVSIEQYHDVGDIALFRYDIAHWVSSVDIERPINTSSTDGRWSLVIPYY